MFVAARHVLVTGILLSCAGAAMGQYDPPSGYYDTATGTGATLKAQLNEIIGGHTVYTYSQRTPVIKILDEDPANPNNLILVYSGYSVPKTDFPQGSSNTEHLWCNAYGLDDTTPAYSDFFNMRPCNASVNSSRGDKYFDDVGGVNPAHVSAPECRADSSRWEPRPVEKGDLARSMFYMDTRYEGDVNDGFPRDLTLTDNVGTITTVNNNFGKLSAMIAWHYQDPVADVERKRNHMIYTDYQHNRNPYIDHPEFVWAVFGTGPNDSKLYVGGIEPADGASSAAVDFGSLIVNAPLPTPQSVTLNKVGTTPTTYNATLSGDATSTSAGVGLAFVGGTQSSSVNVGLPSTSTAGIKAGSIVIDNTDLTSAAAGQGNADANDTISVTAQVLDHANASFASPTDQDSLLIDFGTVALNGPASQGFSINNLVATPGATARLDIDSISSTGDGTILTTNLAPTSNLAAGSSLSLTASMNTALAGSFSATYTIAVSDENLPGATAGTSMTLTLTGIVSSCDAADVNCDTLVDVNDLGDFVNVLLGLASPCSSCAANLNADAGIDGGDIQSFIARLAP